MTRTSADVDPTVITNYLSERFGFTEALFLSFFTADTMIDRIKELSVDQTAESWFKERVLKFEAAFH